MLTGRLVGTDTGVVAARRRAADASGSISRRRILHIAKSSVPERWSGFTIRTLHNLRAQRDAGLDPYVVTEIGWPREAGVTDVLPVVDYEGFEHYRLDQGPDYHPADMPNDRPGRHGRTMVPIVARFRPAILHAHSGYRGGDHALVALALRERSGSPSCTRCAAC